MTETIVNSIPFFIIGFLMLNVWKLRKELKFEKQWSNNINNDRTAVYKERDILSSEVKHLREMQQKSSESFKIMWDSNKAQWYPYTKV